MGFRENVEEEIGLTVEQIDSVLTEKIGRCKTFKDLVKRRQDYLGFLIEANECSAKDLSEVTGYEEKKLDMIWEKWKWNSGDMLAISQWLNLKPYQIISLFSHDIPRLEKLVGKKIGDLKIMSLQREKEEAAT